MCAALFTLLSSFVGLLVLPIAPQQAQQAQTANDAAEHETGLVFALGLVKVNAVAKNAQIHYDAEDVANGATRLVGFLQQKVVEQKGDDNQGGIDEVIGCFFCNHKTVFWPVET